MIRIECGDADAFENIYKTYYRTVFEIGFRILGDIQSAEDLAQVVFLKVWTAPTSFANGAFEAWLSRVARNRAIDVLRYRSSRIEHEMPTEISSDSSLDDIVCNRIVLGRVRSALSTLPEAQRELIELGFLADVAYSELARSRSIPLGTVKTRIRTGLRALRSALI